MQNPEKEIALNLLEVVKELQNNLMKQRNVDARYRQSELVVLMCLYKSKEALRISDISNKLQVKLPTVTQLVNQLVDNGLVEKRADEKDKRIVRIILTEKGLQVSKETSDKFVTRYHDLTNYLGKEDSEQFIRIMKKVNQYYAQKGEKKES